MKLPWLHNKCPKKIVSPSNDEQLDKLDEKMQNVEEKLEHDKAIIPQLNKAVASARRVKYRVDSFTSAMYDGMRGAGGHG